MFKNGQSKILYIVTLGNWGGAQKYVYSLSTHFAVKNSVMVACGQEFDELPKRLAQRGIRCVSLKHLKRNVNIISEILAMVEIYRLVKNFQPDIVHLNSSKAGVLGSIASKLAGCRRVIFTIHGLVLTEPLPWIKRLFYAAGEKFSAYFKDYLIAVSAADYRAALEYRLKPKEKMAVIHNGLDFAELKLLPRDTARVQLSRLINQEIAQQPLIATIADFYPAKGLSFFIEAARLLGTKFASSVWLIIGRSGPDEKNIENLMRKYQLKNLIILKNVDEAARYLAAFDVFVLSSVKEGLPYTLLEAAAAGLPIVATSVGGIPEIITNNRNGLLVQACDPQDLAQAVQRLLEDKILAGRLADEAKKYSQAYTLDKMLAATKNIYELLF